jgi:ribosomal protein S18 acetylase RimI-like enzyme
VKGRFIRKGAGRALRVPTKQEIMLINIRIASAADAEVLRDLRLEALRLHPVAFSADLESNAKQPVAFWQERAEANHDKCIFLAELDGVVVGMTGIRRGEVPKTRHAATIWGVYVKAEARGRGVGEKLMKAAVEWARQEKLTIVKLAVIATNATALRCYERAGFETYGREPAAIFYEGEFHDELLMALRIG